MFDSHCLPVQEYFDKSTCSLGPGIPKFYLVMKLAALGHPTALQGP